MNLSSPKSFGFSIFDRLFGFIESLRPTDRWIFVLLLVIFFISTIWTIYSFSRSHLVNVPVSGGVLIEGAIGSPRFINPILAITRADNDLVALTYSGLTRLSPEGIMENDLAESITISDDGRVYNIILRQDKYFHDGTKIKAEDVAFTISLIQKPSLKSPLYGNWSGVTVEVIDTYELNFVIDKPYTPFQENFTLGILPKHIWSTLSEEELPFSQHNIEPVGSGSYQVEKVLRNPAGLISEYELRTASEYRQMANIDRIIIKFYQNEESVFTALQKGEITSTAYLSERWISQLNKDQFYSVSEPLPRVFSIFFNQNKNPSLRDASARKALDISIDREELMKEVVNGIGHDANSPIPTSWLGTESSKNSYFSKDERLAEARKVLEDGGWRQSTNGRWIKTIDEVDTPLLLTVRSTNDILFDKISAYLIQVWKELGADVSFEFYEQSDLVQTVIRPRDYQALLFGVDLGRSLDLYPFWHSASREDPGLNVSLYANIAVDRIVSEIRLATTTESRDGLIKSFTEEIEKEKPAIFLFAPSFEYILRSNIKTAEMKKIQKSSERFSNVVDWHMNESGVWPFFKNE